MDNMCLCMSTLDMKAHWVLEKIEKIKFILYEYVQAEFTRVME